MTIEEARQEEAFWSAIKANPFDTLPRKVFADWCDENRHSSLAFALRWSAERKLYPHVSPGGRVVTWWRKPVPRVRRIGGRSSPWMVPAVVFDAIRPRYDQRRCKSASVPQAFRQLADALAVLRHELGWQI